jgi:hypothetical protein
MARASFRGYLPPLPRSLVVHAKRFNYSLVAVFDWWLFDRWLFNRRPGLVFIWRGFGWLFLLSSMTARNASTRFR